MPRNNPPLPISLNTEELKELMSIAANHGKHSRRAKILILSFEHPDWSNQQLGKTIGVSIPVLSFWRRRWAETHSIETAKNIDRKHFHHVTTYLDHYQHNKLLRRARAKGVTMSKYLAGLIDELEET